MWKPTRILNLETMQYDIKSAWHEVEEEEINKGLRPFEKSSPKIQKKRVNKVIQKVASKYNNYGTNAKKWFSNSLTVQQYLYEVTSLGHNKQNPLSTLIHQENRGEL